MVIITVREDGGTEVEGVDMEVEVEGMVVEVEGMVDMVTQGEEEDMGDIMNITHTEVEEVVVEDFLTDQRMEDTVDIKMVVTMQDTVKAGEDRMVRGREDIPDP